MRRSKAWQAEIDKRVARFEQWLEVKDALLLQFIEQSPFELQEQLDLSAESLNALEAWLIEQYPRSPSEHLPFRPIRDLAHLAWPENDPSQYLHSAALYVGEALCHEFPEAYWTIKPEDPDYVVFDVPIIIGPKMNVICPLDWIFICLETRTGSMLYTAYERNMA